MKSLNSFALEFENEKDLREMARRLLSVYGVTGEFGLRPLKDGRWRHEVNAEQALSETTLSAVRGQATFRSLDVAGA